MWWPPTVRGLLIVVSDVLAVKASNSTFIRSSRLGALHNAPVPWELGPAVVELPDGARLRGRGLRDGAPPEPRPRRNKKGARSGAPLVLRYHLRPLRIFMG